VNDIEEIVKDGWIKTSTEDNGYFIFERGNERMTYNSESHQVLSYEFKDIAEAVRSGREA
jgi:hypothetical protein